MPAPRPNNMPKFIQDAYNYAFGKVPRGYEEDFRNFAVLYFLERGTYELYKIQAQFLRATFGDTRSISGRLKSNASRTPLQSDYIMIADPYCLDAMREFEEIPMRTRRKAHKEEFLNTKYFKIEISKPNTELMNRWKFK